MKYSKIITTAVAGIVALGLAAPAFAEDNGTSIGAGATSTANFKLEHPRLGSTTMPFVRPEGGAGLRASSTEKRIEKVQTIGKNEIERRIKSLQELSDRIGSMKRLSADQISQIQATIQAEITALTNLENLIGNDTSTTTLKGDVGEITKANRVYLLVIPQGQITAAADRILGTAGQLENLSTKLAARIAAAQAAGTDVTAFNGALTDMNAKIADAKTQANAAAAEVAGLKADNGDATIKTANTAALKDARTKLDAARKDIQLAYTDAKTIAQGVKGKGESATVHATSSSEGNTGN